MYFKKLEILLLLIGTLTIYACNFDACRESSDSVRYAKSLTKEELEILFYNMQEYWAKHDTPKHGYILYGDTTNVPDVFKKLEADEVRPLQKVIMLEGCMEEFVFMKFSGFSEDANFTGKKTIELRYHISEQETATEILWNK